MLTFQNKGVLPIEGFTTFGMSAKPGSTNPIGKFGTGLKNAVAITLRLGGTFRVWRGLEEYVFYTKDEEFRGQTFKRVRMKRRKGLLSRWQYETLPFTTELGKHWAPWMAFRELEANTRDEEDGTTTYISTEGPLQYLPREGTTLIVVDLPEMDDAYATIDDIFLPEQVPVFENASVRIFAQKSHYVFYRGMRVTDLRKPSMFTYEMKHVALTEDRTSMYTFMDNDKMMAALLECPDRKVVDAVVRCGKEYHEAGLDWDKHRDDVSPAWGLALSGGHLGSRFETLRDNLNFGLGQDEDVAIELQVKFWEVVLSAVKPIDESVYIQIFEQMEESGWKDKPSNIDAIAREAHHD